MVVFSESIQWMPLAPRKQPKSMSARCVPDSDWTTPGWAVQLRNRESELLQKLHAKSEECTALASRLELNRLKFDQVRRRRILYPHTHNALSSALAPAAA